MTPNDKPPGFDPKDASLAMNKADEMEHVQELADRDEVTSVTKLPAALVGPGLLEGPPPVPVAPPKPVKRVPEWLPDAFVTSP